MGDNLKMPNRSDALRVGVAGAGAFGRNHARVYRDLQADPCLLYTSHVVARQDDVDDAVDQQHRIAMRQKFENPVNIDL